ncbi:DNA topoisomerase 1-like [Clytia hemisphaerica]|uniref:DNA topoisomerase I n=1 Tax=Clytia hemisphaerica TaxID=252671 RepID=A0A7M5WUK7_9CNID|eukprot:TCONS_00011539-protein
MMADLDLLGNSKSPLKSPGKTLPKIPKKVKEEPQSPVKSPTKSPTTNGHSNGSAKKEVKKEEMSDDEDMPLQSVKKESRKRKVKEEDEDFEDSKKKKKKKDKKKVKKEAKEVKKESPKKRVKKEEVKEEVWRWWEETPHPEGIKWKTLEHNGPYFPPAYERLPKNVKFYYDGELMELSEGAEEVATFYSKMLEHDYTKKDIFNNNFFEDWRKEMTDQERKKIKKLEKCNFQEMCDYFKEQSEIRKNKTKEEKLALKEENAAIAEQYGMCIMDGHKQKVGNFRIEPPGLFRGRGDHPKQGKLKKRVKAKEVSINIGKAAPVPQPPEGQKWKAVQHDASVTWLACWTENITGSNKYVMLNAATRIKGEKDWQKYETARKLKGCVHKIRENYKADWKSKEMRIRQRAVAMYFIDKLALRAGHEKEEGESADTVGCCSLRVEHIKLYSEKDGEEYVVEFDFLGKDSIRYTNSVPVEKRVYKNLELFKQNKQPGDDLFDRLNTGSLNKFLGEQMPGLTAKVFRTYNASNTLQQQLDTLTEPDANVTAKFLQYNRANRAVAILCNHQRAPPKTFDKQMENLITKLKDKKKQMKTVKKEIKELKKEYHNQGKSEKVKNMIEKKKKQAERLEEQYFKLEVNMTDKEENKEIALGTSKLNYLDPRISIAWCKKNDVPIEKIYNKTQREKFQWAIDMTDETFVF